MRIVQLCKYYVPAVGGMETVIADITHGAVQLGHIVDVVCCNRSIFTLQESLPGGGRLIRAGWLGQWFRMPVSISFLWYALRASWRADVVIVHHPNPLAFVVGWLLPRRVPLVVWYHADITRQKVLAAVLHTLLTSVLRLAHTIVVLDNALAEQSRFMQPHMAKSVVIPYGIQVVDHTPEVLTRATALRQQYSEPLLLSVGRLVSYKGYHYFLDALVNTKGHLVIIGDGPLQSSLRSRIAELGLAGRVTLVPFVTPEDMPTWFLAADVFVFPSVTPAEAFGLVQVEAMAAGVPVINTHLPTAVPGVSVHGQTGLTVPPRDSRALAEAINTLLTDSDLRVKLGAQARQRVLAEYSHERFIERLAQLFATI